MISDASIIIGFFLVTYGLLYKFNFLTIAGTILCVLAKQTSILLAPIFFLFYVTGYLKLKDFLLYCSCVVLGFIGIKISTYYLFGVTGGSHFSSHVLGVFAWLFKYDPTFAKAFNFYFLSYGAYLFLFNFNTAC